jgi:hypothetical protein
MVGDDGLSWGVEGSSALKWHADEFSPFGGLWKDGDVVGLACDLRTGGGRIMVSLNGDFAPPYGAAFDLSVPAADLEGGLCPVLSAVSGVFYCNFGVGAPFRYAPPSPEYSVMTAAGTTV